MALFFTYGIKLFWYDIGIDAEAFMDNRSGMLLGWISIGRFGLNLLIRLWRIKEYNPFISFAATFCLIWCFTLSWCYIIAVFSKNIDRNNALIPFALVFMTMPVWAEIFYFVFQAAETAFIITLCPYVIYFLFKGFIESRKAAIFFAFFMMVFMTSVYQAIVPFFCCGVFLCFILLRHNSDYPARVYTLLCFQLFVTLVAALVVYSCIDRLIIPAVFHIRRTDFFDNINKWGKIPVFENIVRIMAVGYVYMAGYMAEQLPLVQNFVARYARSGRGAVEFWAGISRVHGNILFLPLVLFFIVELIKTARRKIPAGGRISYALAGIGVPLSIILLALVGGTFPSIRTQWAMPLAAAFMIYFLVKTYKKKAAMIVCVLALFTAVRQIEITSQLFYSDHIRYTHDVRMARDLAERIKTVQNETNSLPVIFIGSHKADSVFTKNFLQGEVPGHSFFEWDGGNTQRILAFMRTLGVDFMSLDTNKNEQISQAARTAESMPVYPAPGCVKRLDGIIIIKMGI
ncbi:MAG: glucosyltransferase domain-containing protein [Treponema sp.]|nr:glucosyltransferase domain-containing protein [Treponema sp.]